MCAALVPVISRLTAAPGLDLNAPEATKQAYLTYLNEGVAVTDQARARLAAAGAAPVPDGDVIAEQVRGEVADLRVDLTAARDQVQRTDTSSAVAIGRAIVGVSRVVGALLNGAQVAATVNRDPTLAAAYTVSPSCAQLQRSGAPATAPPTAPSSRPGDLPRRQLVMSLRPNRHTASREEHRRVGDGRERAAGHVAPVDLVGQQPGPGVAVVRGQVVAQVVRAR